MVLAGLAGRVRVGACDVESKRGSERSRGYRKPLQNLDATVHGTVVRVRLRRGIALVAHSCIGYGVGYIIRRIQPCQNKQAVEQTSAE